MLAGIITASYVLGLLLHTSWPAYMKTANPESPWLDRWRRYFDESGWGFTCAFWPISWPVQALFWWVILPMFTIPRRLGEWVGRRRRATQPLPKAVVDRRKP